MPKSVANTLSSIMQTGGNASVQSQKLQQVEDALQLQAYQRWRHKSYNIKVGKRPFSLEFNPVTTCVSIAIIWGFVLYCVLHAEGDEGDHGAQSTLNSIERWIRRHFTWAYVLTQAMWVVFVTWISFSKYGNIKLGGPDDKPEYSAITWFVMIFSAGVGIGLFYFGVAEPIDHYEPCKGKPFAGLGSECTGNRYVQLRDDERSTAVLTLTVHHWCLLGFVTYAVVGLLLAFLTYRVGLPLTIKSCFYPLIGDKIYGWIGDMVDVIAVFTTIFGVCTSLGLGVRQVNEGLSRLFKGIPNTLNVQLLILWTITICATASVVSGVKHGIKRISQVTFAIGLVILVSLMLMDDTFYLLNIVVQVAGDYLQKLVSLSFFTEAFSQAAEDKLYAAPDKVGAKPTWMDEWTIFYWGWWISWAPFVGMFVAKISKGRTIREFCIGVLFAPAAYTLVWMCVFGGVGLRMERVAANLGVECKINDDDKDNLEYVKHEGYIYHRLACHSDEAKYFDVYDQYPLKQFYCVISIIAIAMYFITSSDSGSIVVDSLTANGHPTPPKIQRVFWALTEGATATALLVAGGEESLQALRSAAIIVALPFSAIMCWMCQSLYMVILKDQGELPEETPAFKTEIFDPISTQIIPATDPDAAPRRYFNRKLFTRAVIAIVAPWIEVRRALKRQQHHNFTIAGVTLSFYLFPLLLIINVWVSGLWALAWVSYIIFCCILGLMRAHTRMECDIIGDPVTDVIVFLLAYPLAVVQMADEANPSLPARSIGGYPMAHGRLIERNVNGV